MATVKTYQLVELSTSPTFPAIWSSEKGGEGYVWGDFVITFQVSPMTIQEGMGKMLKTDGFLFSPIKHLYSLTVFYRAERSPHGPSSLPIMAATIEVANLGNLMRLLGEDNPKKGMGEPMLCLFSNGTHRNFGEYSGDINNREECRQSLFRLIQEVLDLRGVPESLGGLCNAQGLNNGTVSLEEARRKRDGSGLSKFFKSLFR